MEEEEEDCGEENEVCEIGSGRRSSQMWLIEAVFSTIASHVLFSSYFHSLSSSTPSSTPPTLHILSMSPCLLLCWGVLPPFCSQSEKWSCVPGGGSNEKLMEAE